MTLKKIRVTDISRVNAFGKAIGYQPNDILVSINGKEVDAGNANAIIGTLYKTARVGDPLEIVVKRKGLDGQEQAVTLSAPMMKLPVMKFNVLTFNPSPSVVQKDLQDSWLNAK